MFAHYTWRVCVNGEQNSIDERVRVLCEAGARQAAAELVLQRHGGDVLRILLARFRDEEHASECFARFTEALWLALPDFAFRCSVRAWVFTLARNTAHRYLQRELRRARKTVPLSSAHPLAAQERAVRTETQAHLRTANKERVTALRARLAADDQLLLTLRIDRGLEFAEIAHVMLGDENASEADIRREAARLRKRLSAIKDKLRALLE
jgi:RNA polymerase sigma-70 factor (ECF subfamily)